MLTFKEWWQQEYGLQLFTASEQAIAGRARVIAEQAWDARGREDGKRLRVFVGEEDRWRKANTIALDGDLNALTKLANELDPPQEAQDGRG